MFYILTKEGEEIHIIMEMKDQTSYFLTVLSLFTMELNEKTLKQQVPRNSLYSFTYSINLGRMKECVDFAVTQWF